MFLIAKVKKIEHLCKLKIEKKLQTKKMNNTMYSIQIQKKHDSKTTNDHKSALFFLRQNLCRSSKNCNACKECNTFCDASYLLHD